MSKSEIKTIVSYGILLFNKNNEILMVNRKNSICYIEFILGKFSLLDVEYIELLFNRITNEEKKDIQNNKYEVLWLKLWGDSKQTKYYYCGLNKFNIIKKNNILLNRLCKEGIYNNTEWEFSKGRKNKNEINIDCAIRELCEETNINKDDFNIFRNICPIIETYISKNNIRYKSVYYIGYCHNMDNTKINKDNKIQMSEIKDVRWVSKSAGSDMIREYNIHKIDVINKLFNIIDTYKRYFYIYK